MTDLSDAYANTAHIPGGDAYPARWAAQAAAFRAAHPPRALRHGPGARGETALFSPEGTARGTVILVHGGYWSAFHPEDFSHLAAGALARGWHVAMPAYDLCPGVRIGAITRRIAGAVDAVAQALPGPLVVTGHSAGGHLAARMGCADAAPAAIGRIVRIVPVSPLGLLAPLMQTAMNATLGLDAAEAAAESPALHPAPAASVRVWVGAEERPAFLDQAWQLATAWAAPLTIEPGRHHLDVIEGYEDPASPLLAALLDGIG